MDELIQRLSRYSEKAISDALDPDFAKAVYDVIEEQKGYMLTLLTMQQMKEDLKDCRNELCLRCGDYKMRHKGACDGCRWKDGG